MPQEVILLFEDNLSDRHVVRHSYLSGRPSPFAYLPYTTTSTWHPSERQDFHYPHLKPIHYNLLSKPLYSLHFRGPYRPLLEYLAWLAWF
jgi:hypothetical protein